MGHRPLVMGVARSGSGTCELGFLYYRAGAIAGLLILYIGNHRSLIDNVGSAVRCYRTDEVEPWEDSVDGARKR